MPEISVLRGLPFVVVAVALSVATVTDVRTLRVHNWLTFPLLFGGFLYHFIVDGTAGLAGSVASAFVVIGLLLLPFVLGAIGAGDVKLLAALAAWLGTPMTFRIAAISLFATGIYSLVKLARQRRLADSWVHFKVSVYRVLALARSLGTDAVGESVHDMAARPDGRARLVPFSGMLALGTAVMFAWKLIP